ncbi:NACHT domain-containing protein [Dactylosporangium darangshiense]
MRRPGLVLVAVEALVVLVLLPVTVNVATGGSAPPGLSGLRPFAWYAVAALALVAVGVPAWRYLGDGRGLGGVGYSRYHRETQRERVLQRLRARVDGELARALADVPWIPPRLAVRPDAVRPSPDLLPAAAAEGPPGDVREAFERSDRSLLVLGGPGAGKSTLLLDLARRLLDGDAVPVLLGLGGWRDVPGRAGPATFTRWCVAEMARHNGIPRPLAAQWLQDDEVVLLFDGLDEMPQRLREGFLAILAAVQRERGPLAMAVTCRTAEYERLRPGLDAQGAVEIEPLVRSDVDALLERADDLGGLSEAWRADARLRELVDSPLLLALLAAQARAGRVGASGGGRSLLLERYLTVALSGRAYPPGRPAPPARLRRWLGTVAAADRPWGGYSWPEALGRDVAQPFAGALLPALVIGVGAGLFGAGLGMTPLPWLAGVAALAAVLGGAGVWAARRELMWDRSPLRRVPLIGATGGLVAGAAAGALAAAVLAVLRAAAPPGWVGMTVAAGVVAIGLTTLLYRAMVAEQQDHPERTARTDTVHQHAAAGAVTERYRLRQQAFSTGEGRAAMYSMYGAMAVAMLIITVGAGAAAPLVLAPGLPSAVAAGLLLGAAVAGGRRLAGLGREHPALRAALVLRPRAVIAALVLAYALLCADIFSSFRVSHWLATVAGGTGVIGALEVFLGFVGAQAIGFWLVGWSALTDSLAAATARLVLAAAQRLPWRIGRFLAYASGTGVMRRDGDRFAFRHEQLAEHCRQHPEGAQT